MRVAVVALVASLLVMATSNASAARFAFDPDSALGSNQPGNVIPVAIVAVVSLSGAILIFLERKKARGIWFSNSGRLK